ncbi:MAG: hypothetical protein KGQ66_15505 [Acidobacteriota bacterium]|nr:hypothetical protein [Acidobacteriota bacterium]
MPSPEARPIRGFARGTLTRVPLRYTVASDGRQRITAGRIAGTAVSPVGTIHAVDVSLGRVVCGYPLRELFDFPEMDWMTLRAPGRCPSCAAGTAAASS